jgi:hypothetical protein
MNARILEIANHRHGETLARWCIAGAGNRGIQFQSPRYDQFRSVLIVFSPRAPNVHGVGLQSLDFQGSSWFGPIGVYFFDFNPVALLHREASERKPRRRRRRDRVPRIARGKLTGSLVVWLPLSEGGGNLATFDHEDAWTTSSTCESAHFRNAIHGDGKRSVGLWRGAYGH